MAAKMVPIRLIPMYRCWTGTQLQNIFKRKFPDMMVRYIYIDWQTEHAAKHKVVWYFKYVG